MMLMAPYRYAVGGPAVTVKASSSNTPSGFTYLA